MPPPPELAPPWRWALAVSGKASRVRASAVEWKREGRFMKELLERLLEFLKVEIAAKLPVGETSGDEPWDCTSIGPTLGI
jgi:hypothetical protein